MTAHLEVEWTEHVERHDGGKLAVVEALLPVVSWPRVEIRRAIDEELSTVERFLLEAASQLGWLTPEVVEEIAGLPQGVSAAVIEGLAGFGLLTKSGTDFFAVEAEIESSLRRNALRRVVADTCSVLFLPHTHEAVAYSVPVAKGRRRSRPAPHLPRAAGGITAPLGSAVTGRRPSEVLGELLRANRITNLPDDVLTIGMPTDETPMPESCPVYRAEGVVGAVTGSPSCIDLQVQSHDQRVHVDLSGAEELAKRWLRLAEVPCHHDGLDHIATALGCEARDLTVQEDGILLNGRACVAFARQGDLATSGGFLVSDSTVVIAVPVELRPADLEATVHFALDHAATEMRRSRDRRPTDLLSRACRNLDLPEDALAPAALADRLWVLSQFDLVYSLRAPWDFAYD